MKEATVLLEVMDRKSKEVLIPAVERAVEISWFDCDTTLINRAKDAFLAELEKQIKHKPSMRKKFEGKDWYVDGIVV